MNIVDLIIILIVIVCIGFAIRASIKHFKGEGACCGGGGSDIVSEKKSLSGPILGKKVMKISGMHCEHCVANVTKALNAIDGASAQVDLKDECAIVSYDRQLNDDVLKQAVEKAGYKVIAIA